jgi:hypothetical protein
MDMASAPARTIRVGGRLVRLEPRHAAFAAALDLWLRPGADARGDAEIVVRLEAGSAVVPEVPPSREHGPVRVWRDGAVVCVSDGENVGRADVVSGAVELVASEPSASVCWLALHRCLRTLLSAVLAERGRFGVHAGAVALAGRAVVIVGASGAGKSTLTAHLVGAGATFLADDTVYVGGRPAEVAGWPERTRVLDGPAVSVGASRAPDGKAAVAPGHGDTGDHPAGLVLLLGGGRGETASPEPVGPADLMARLLRSSTFALSPDVEAARIAALAALAEVPAGSLPSRPQLPTIDEVAAWMQH